VWTEVSLDFELMVLFGVLVALCIWFVVANPVRGPGLVERPAASLPFDRFAFVGRPELLADVILAKDETSSPTEPAPPPAPLQTAAIERHSLLAEPLFDPLGSVVFSGLPPRARLSAGATLSPTDWAVAFGDLDNLVIRLPAERSGPIRTTFDLRTRAGVRIHSFSIELQQDEPAKTVTGPKKSKASPVKDDLEKVVRPVKKNARKAAVIVPTKAIQAAKPVAAPPPLPAAPPVKVPAPQPATSAGSPGLFSILPFGFFAPDPKDSAASGLSPDLRDDPRFTTLRGLGVKPTDLPDLPPDAP